MKIVKKNFDVEVLEKGFNLWANGEEIFYFGYNTSVNSDVEQGPAKFEQISENEFNWITKSNLWDKKVYSLRVENDNLIYSVKVYGKGILGKVRYITDTDYNTCGYYIPTVQHNAVVNPHRLMVESSSNFLCLHTPSPLCYIFDIEENPAHIGIGLLTSNGEYNFDKFDYEYADCRFALSTDFYEYTVVDGEYQLPSLLINVGENEEDVLKKYAKYHYENGYCTNSEKTPSKWWYGPQFCGWGDQWFVMLDYLEKNHPELDTADIDWGAEVIGDLVKHPLHIAKDAANEVEYRKMLKKCEEKNITYSSIIIDDMWQKSYGTLEVDTDKWSDMRAFTDEMHKKGKKVILWVGLWRFDDLPQNECILRDGVPVAADPTSPAYIERIKRVMHNLLSDDEGCCNADGFKLDFANNVPIGKGLSAHEKGVYGIEMLKRMMQLFYDSAKNVKPDALISSSCAHPYFREAMDMFRLHDYYSISNNGYSNLKNRTMFGKTMLGDDIVVDTDAMTGNRRRDVMLGMRNCTKFGVPSLYGFVMFDFLTDDDWKEISKIYKEYSESL